MSQDLAVSLTEPAAEGVCSCGQRALPMYGAFLKLAGSWLLMLPINI